MGLEPTLSLQEAAWDERKLVRRAYSEWYRWITERLATVPGQSIELGSGIGKLRLATGDRVLLTDVERTRWVDAEVDALSLPYRGRSLANIVLVDVFHHLSDPGRFLGEATRTLAPGGRLIMVEPYCSPLSTVLYERFHHERTDLSVDPFAVDEISAAAPMESNQAIPTLAFYKRRRQTFHRWSSLVLVEEKRFSFLVYPLSGGFSRRPLVPASLFVPLRAAERLLQPLAALLAFRCLLVLERVP